MARKPSQRGHRGKEEIAPLNIIPVMNLMIILIPALLMMASFIQFAVINVAAPQIGSGEPTERDEDKEPPLNLTVTVTEMGFTVSGTGASLPSPQEDGGPTIPKTGDEYDFAALTTILVEIKDSFPDEEQIIINAEADIEYKTIIDVMDASREYDGRLLFHQVVFSTGFV